MPLNHRVLFVCVHNAGRSQMAAAFLRARTEGTVDVLSAGSSPAATIDPCVLEAMLEIGIDLSGYSPNPLDQDRVRQSDVVVTMGCGDACPVFPGVLYEDWDIEDPSGKDIESVRRIRDRISELVDRLIAGLPSHD